MNPTRNTYRRTLATIAFLIGIIMSNSLNAQWTNLYNEVSTIPGTSNQFVKFANTSTGYYQNSRYLYKTTNGGTTWARVDSSVISNYDRIDMQVLSANDVFCIEAHNLGNYTYTYYLRKTSNGGATWTSTLLPYVGNSNNGYYNDFCFSSTTNGMLATAYGQMYHTTNGGSSWTSIPLQTGTEYIARFNFANSTVGYAVETFGKLYKTTNGGATWTFMSNICSSGCSNFQDIDFVHQDTGIAVNGYDVFKTVNGGASWTQKPVTGQVVVFRDVEYASSDTIYTSGYSFCRSVDGGEHFQALSYLNPGTWQPFSTSMIYSVSAFTGTSVYVTGVTNSVPNVNIPGVYRMTNNGIGCPGTVMYGTSVVCPDTASNFMVQTTASAPGAYVYSWSPSSYLGTPNNYYSSGSNATPDDTVVFTVTITDTTFGCPPASGQQTIITRHNSNWQNSWPWPTNPVTACPGDTLHMGPGALGYHWSNGDTTEYIVLNTFPSFYNCMVDVCPGGSSGLFFAVSLDSNCTQQSCSVSAGPDTVFCQSQNPQLNAIPGTPGNNYIFQWYPSSGLSNPNIANPTVYGVNNQVYTVTMTDTVTNCSATDTIVVSEYHFTANDTFYSCNNANVILDFGPGATTYFWQFFTDTAGNTTPLNYTTQTISVNQPGSYGGYAFFPGCGALTSIFNVVDSCVTSSCSVNAGPDTVFCQQQGQLNATPGTPGNYTFSWSPAFGLSNPNVQNPTVISGVNNQQYVVTMSDGNCTATDTVIVSAYYFHIDTLYICNNGPITYDLGPGGTNYTTQFTDTSGNFQFYTLPNNYLVITQPAQYLCIAFYPGCGALTSMITVIDSCNVPVGNVWPGDCNYDLTVNMADVLNIGIGYNTTGPVRPGATNGWYAQPMNDWTQNYINCNYKHGDADGNGSINVNDTLPVSLNYSLTHPYHFVPEVPVTASTPTLELVASYDTCGLQTVVNVDIRLGTSSIPVDSLYGIAFRINMDPTLIDTMMTSMNYTGSWLGTIGSNMIGFRKPFPAAGVIDACEVRTNQLNFINGSGSIGGFQIVTTDNLSGIAVLHLGISDVKAITISETLVPLAIVADSVVIDPTLQTGIQEQQAAAFSMYPNPANGMVTINTRQPADQVEVLDMLGRSITRVKPNGRSSQLDLQQLSAGIYLVRVQQGNNSSTQKLTITR